jgi:hypothetical protein
MKPAHLGSRNFELGSWFAAALAVSEVKFAQFTRQRYEEYGDAIRASGLKAQ